MELQSPQNGVEEINEQVLLKEAQDFHRDALVREDANFRAAADDLRMLAEDQWDPQARWEREQFGRPLVQINLFDTYLGQITGEIRRNKPAIHVSLADGDANRDTAEALEGVIRNIERQSGASMIYSMVARSVAACGMGHAELDIEWADEESFEQELVERFIDDPFAVLWDGDAKRADKGDAKKCLVVTEMDKAVFNKKWPGKTSANWAQNRPFSSTEKWRCGDKVTVAKYWVVKETPVTLHRMVNNRSWFDPSPGVDQFTGAPLPPTLRRPTGRETVLKNADEAILGEAQRIGFSVVQTRQAMERKVCCYLIGGNALLEPPIEWPGKRIPVFSCYGEETHTGESVVRKSAIRNGKDAQKSFNLARSLDMEQLGLAPKAPWEVVADAIAGHEDIWNNAHKVPFPYLPRNRFDDAGREIPAPTRADPIPTNPGPQIAAKNAVDDLQAAIGIFSSNIGQRAPETSGKAIQARDEQADTSTFWAPDNLNNQLIAPMGQEMVNVIPIVYSDRTMLAIVGPDDQAGVLDLKARGIDLALGKYRVFAKTGPAYSTRREKAVDRFIAMLNVAPEPYVPLLFEQIVTMDDIPNADEFVRRVQEITARLLAPPAPPPGMAPGMAPPGAMPPEAMPQDIPPPPEGPPIGPPMGPPPEFLTSPAGPPAPGARVGPPPFLAPGPAGIGAMH